MSDSEPFEGERRLAAIMFTDMVGFTTLTQRNEVLALELLDEQRRLIRSVLTKYRGREVDMIGDGFLLEFASSLEAMRCAVEIQSVLKHINAKRSEEKRIWIRIGIHLGDIVHNGTKVAGDAVNVASRIEEATKQFGTPLLASESVLSAAHELNRWKVVTIEPLRGRAEAIRILAPALSTASAQLDA